MMNSYLYLFTVLSHDTLHKMEVKLINHMKNNPIMWRHSVHMVCHSTNATCTLSETMLDHNRGKSHVPQA